MLENLWKKNQQQNRSTASISIVEFRQKEKKKTEKI